MEKDKLSSSTSMCYSAFGKRKQCQGCALHLREISNIWNSPLWTGPFIWRPSFQHYLTTTFSAGPALSLWSQDSFFVPGCSAHTQTASKEGPMATLLTAGLWPQIGWHIFSGHSQINCRLLVHQNVQSPSQWNVQREGHRAGLQYEYSVYHRWQCFSVLKVIISVLCLISTKPFMSDTRASSGTRLWNMITEGQIQGLLTDSSLLSCRVFLITK